jgi:hypothetical protein
LTFETALDFVSVCQRITKLPQSSQFAGGGSIKVVRSKGEKEMLAGFFLSFKGSWEGLD